MLKTLFLAFLLFLTSCSTLRLDHKVDAAYDFSEAESFSWSSPPIGSTVKGLDRKFYDLVRKNTKEIINNNLLAKGYSQKQTGGNLTVEAEFSTYSNATIDKIILDDDYYKDQESKDVKRFKVKIIIKDKITKMTVFESEASDIMTEKKNRVNRFRQTLFTMMEKMPRK